MTKKKTSKKTTPKKTSKHSSKGLGRGMESLIPTEVVAADFDPAAAGPSASRTKQVLIHDIKPNADQPRRNFDDKLLKELAVSIEAHGVLQPLLVVDIDSGNYQLIAGERRWRAAQIAGLDRVPVIIRSLNEQAKLEIALIENIQREDLSPLEAAETFARLNKEFNTTFTAIAKRLGKSESTVNNIVRLLGLPQAARDELEAGKISEGHARAILAIPEETRQLELLELIVKYKWSVRQAEQFVKGIKAGATSAKKASEQTKSETTETKALAKKLKASVRIHNMAKGGRLIIDYKDDKDLKRISKKLLN